MTDTWNPAQYNRFERERELPFHDLAALIVPEPGMRVVDLGCGTGRLTRMLHQQLAARETIGVDRSGRMLETAARDPLPPGLRFERGAIEEWLGDPANEHAFDLVFSNAALHWVDDHDRLVAALARTVKPNGQLAFQVPANHDHPSQTVAADLARTEPFRTALGGWERYAPVLTPESYARRLYDAGFRAPRVMLIVYPHVLDAPEDVVEWVKGSLLTDYERRLPPELFDRFLVEYRRMLLGRLPDERPCFFPFKRILCWGRLC